MRGQAIDDARFLFLFFDDSAGTPKIVFYWYVFAHSERLPNAGRLPTGCRGAVIIIKHNDHDRPICPQSTLYDLPKSSVQLAGLVETYFLADVRRFASLF